MPPMRKHTSNVATAILAMILCAGIAAQAKDEKAKKAPEVSTEQKLKIRDAQRAMDQINLRFAAMQQQFDQQVAPIRAAFVQANGDLQKLMADACKSGDEEKDAFVLDPDKLECVVKPPAPAAAQRPGAQPLAPPANDPTPAKSDAK